MRLIFRTAVFSLIAAVPMAPGSLAQSNQVIPIEPVENGRCEYTPSGRRPISCFDRYDGQVINARVLDAALFSEGLRVLGCHTVPLGITDFSHLPAAVKCFHDRFGVPAPAYGYDFGGQIINMRHYSDIALMAAGPWKTKDAFWAEFARRSNLPPAAPAADAAKDARATAASGQAAGDTAAAPQPETDDPFGRQGPLSTIDLEAVQAPADQPVLTDALVRDALRQAPPPPPGGFKALGPERVVNRDSEDTAHAQPHGGVGRCDRSRQDCLSYTRQTRVRPMTGPSGWCNPPFVNLAIEQSAVYDASGTSFLIEAHGPAARDLWEIGHSARDYVAQALALDCAGAYVAVQDYYWTGFPHPLFRAVRHLGEMTEDPPDRPECYVEGKWTPACRDRFFDGFGRPDPPVRFQPLQALYASPPDAAERVEILAGLAPDGGAAPPDGAPGQPGFEPSWQAFDEPGRRGVAYTGWGATRLEFGCAGKGYGSMSGRPYAMMSLPVDRMRAGRLFAYATPDSVPVRLRLSFRLSGGAGQGSPYLETGLAAGIQAADGRRFAALVALDQPKVAGIFRNVLGTGRTVDGISMTFFPPEGRGIATVEPTLPPDMALIMSILRGCRP